MKGYLNMMPIRILHVDDEPAHFLETVATKVGKEEMDKAKEPEKDLEISFYYSPCLIITILQTEVAPS
jgi:hypothetical protein